MLSHGPLKNAFAIGFGAVYWLTACGDDDSTNGEGSTGGADSGSSESGGSAGASGGRSSGGTASSGGAVSSGGAANSGGATSSGGVANSGGADASTGGVDGSVDGGSGGTDGDDAGADADVPDAPFQPVAVTHGWPLVFAAIYTPPAGSVLAFRIDVDVKTTLDKIGIISGSETGNFKLAVYADSAGAPGALEYSMTASKAITFQGSQDADVEDGPLGVGAHWLAIRLDAAAKLVQSGGFSTTTRCVRTATLADLDAAWPATFGDATCGTAAVVNVYAKGFTAP